MNKAIAWLNLAVTNNSPLTWLDAGLAPTSTPKARKPSRTKKNNV
jgi:hypothetical protein